MDSRIVQAAEMLGEAEQSAWLNDVAIAIDQARQAIALLLKVQRGEKE